ARQGGRIGSAVETVDERLAVLVVPEAYAARHALLHALPEAGDRGRGVDGCCGGVAEVVADLHAESITVRVGGRGRAAARERAGAGDAAGRGAAVAPVDGGRVGGGAAERVGVDKGGDRAAPGRTGRGAEVDRGGHQRGRVDRQPEGVCAGP